MLEPVVVRIAARMDDPIHIQIQIVELYIIWVWLARVYWYLDAADLFRLLFVARLYNARIFP